MIKQMIKFGDYSNDPRIDQIYWFIRGMTVGIPQETNSVSNRTCSTLLDTTFNNGAFAVPHNSFNTTASNDYITRAEFNELVRRLTLNEEIVSSIKEIVLKNQLVADNKEDDVQKS